jgi:hypothetical protein
MGALATLGVLAVQFLAARGSSLAPLLLVAVVAFDLAAAAWPLQGFAPRQLANDIPAAGRAILAQHAGDQAPARLYRSNQTGDAVNQHVPASASSDGEFRLVQTLITNTVNVWGIATLPGYDAAIPALLTTVWQAGLDIGQSSLRLLAADYVVLPVANPAAPPDDRPGLEPVLDPLPGARLYHVPGALPRVFLARHTEVLADPQALARLYQPEVVAGESAWLAPEGNPPVLAQSPGRAGTCSLESYSNNKLVAACTASERGVAVFVEQYDRGWRATVDGRAAPILRANLIMRALPLEPGSHRIVLDYQTPGLAAGGVLSTICLLVLGAFSLPGGGRKRRDD